MKSLEIVNERIEQVGKRGKVHLFSFETTIDEKDLQEIKQDLEVLEIIKKIFEKANFHFYPDGYEADILLEDNDICIEAIDRITKLKVADVKKIKQWLEVNENG